MTVTPQGVRPAHLEVGIVDTMIGFSEDPAKMYAKLRASLRDQESLNDFAMPASYMFRDVPNKALEDGTDPIALTLYEMDRHGVAVGLISASNNPEVSGRALTEHPDRFVGSWTVDPNEGMAGVRKLVEAHARYDVRAVTFFPHMLSPQVAIDAPQAYPYYAKCVELGIPIFVSVGIAGPRVPSACQHVERLDQVMYDFPELQLVMRHGGEPWVDLAVKLMLKWPGLHYSTSGFAPRHYPGEIVDFANSRGSEKILYAGYFPMGLTLDRIMTELADLPLKDDVWPKFLRGNAARLLKLA